MTNTYSNAQNVQKSDRNIKLADLKFSTTTDVISKISSFQATITGLTYSTGGNTPNNFQGGTVTVYDAAGNALVSDTIVSGTPTLHFVLPNVVNVSKTAPVVFTLKLDQVSNVVVANDTLNLIFSTGGVVARNYITNNSIYPSAATTSSTLTVVGAGTVTTVAQSFSPKLVQLDGSTVSLGTLKFQPFNGDVYLKNINLVLSGYSTTNMPYSEVTVKDSGTTIATLINNGNNNLFATNINAILTAGNTKTYDVVATLKSASTSGDLGTPFVMNLTTGDFESMNGVVIHALPMPVTVSSSTTLVNAKPTISYLSSSKGGNAVYKFRIAANGGDIKLDQLKIAVANNTDAATGTATLYLGNEGGTSLGTSTIATGNNTPTFSNLSGLVDITDGTYQDFTLVFPVSTWYKGTNPGNIGIEMNDINYYDVFTDATTALHSSLFGLYKWDIAPVTTLVTLQ